MARTLLPASQRCPAQKAFAAALCPSGEGAKDAATELYRLLENAQRIHDNPSAKESDLRLATDIVGAGHIVAHWLEVIREMSKALPK